MIDRSRQETTKGPSLLGALKIPFSFARHPSRSCQSRSNSFCSNFVSVRGRRGKNTHRKSKCSVLLDHRRYSFLFVSIMTSASSGDNDEKKKSSGGLKSGFLGKTGTDESPLDKTYYQILNVSPTASPSEIKKAYYSLSLQYHPDRTQSLNEITRRDYAERFKLISQAYSKKHESTRALPVSSPHSHTQRS